MLLGAIHHDMDKRYCFALDKGKFVIRIKTGKDDIKSIVLHTRDKNIPIDRVDTRCKIPMEKVACDGRNDYYEAVLEIDVLCLRYFFRLEDMTGQVLYYGNHNFSQEPFEDIYDMYDCPQNLREEEQFVIPQWAQNKVVYQIFPSRFATDRQVNRETWYQAPIGPKAELHGNLRGIIDHLEHLKDLGVDIFYMTPIFRSGSQHKYDTIDYYGIDPDFGTKEDLRELVEKAHAMGMRVILDAVFNHTSPDFFAFADVREKEEQSAYRDWYYVEEFPIRAGRSKKPGFKTFAYHGGMPKLNLRNAETEQYFIDVALYWLREFHIDGWRLDVGDEISHRFWKRFREAVKEIAPEALIVGEIWHFAGDFLEGDEWDTVMNYPFYQAVRDLVAYEKITPTVFLEKLDHLRGNLHNNLYPVLWNLIDSHDTPRFLHECGEKKEKQKLAAALQLLLPGMPMIYYGDEYGMTGGQDPDCRRGMVWDAEYQDLDMYRWYQTLIRIRKQHACITQGETVLRVADDEKGLIVLTKRLGQEQVTLVFHVAAGEVLLDECEELKVKRFWRDGMVNLLDGSGFSDSLGAYQVAVLQE